MLGDAGAGDVIPTEVLHRNARLISYRLEADVDLSALLRGEGLLTPAKHETLRRLPHLHAPDFEHGAVVEGLGETASLARLERQGARAAAAELKQLVVPPPQPDL